MVQTEPGRSVSTLDRNTSRTTMAPQPQVSHFQPTPSEITQRVQLFYKLFLLENARKTLERELLNLTNKAYEEVLGFFSSSFPNSVFSDLEKALDSKCQAFDKLSALLKDLIAEPRICVKNGLHTKQLQPMTSVQKFGCMLQNSLLASSTSRVVQVLRATLSLSQQLKHFLISTPADVQQNETTCSITPSYNVLAPSSSCHSSYEDKEQAVVSEEKYTPDAVILPPALSPKVGPENFQLPLVPIQAIVPEISNSGHLNKIKPPVIWTCVDDVEVQHQKQTSAQLLQFLKAKAKNVDVLKDTIIEHSRESTRTSDSPRLTPPTVKTQNYQLKHPVTDDGTDTQASKMVSAYIENQATVFKVKKLESNGSLTYTYMTASKSELWDFGDIFTEVGQGESVTSPVENEACRNDEAHVEDSCEDIHRQTQTLHSTQLEYEGNCAAAKTSAINGIIIPEFHFRRFEETEVVVSHVVTPGNFYIQQADSTMKLQALVTDSWKAGSSYAEQNCIPDIGTKVMGWFPNQEQWCRAQVTKICGVSEDVNGPESKTSIMVEVKRLDHGDTTCLSLWNVKELTPELATLPLQAVQVSLANVMPVNGSDWSEEAVGCFHTMVHNRTLYARLYPQGPKVTVELFFEKGRLGAMRRGASMSLRLAQNGHARHSKLRNAGLTNRGTAQVKKREQDSEWEKYLISCFTECKK